MNAARKRMLAAFIAGGALVALSFLLRQEAPADTGPEGLVAVAGASERTVLPVSDADGDGIPDWQEALQQTEPVVVAPVDATYEVPDTLTDQFAVDFFQDMVLSEGYGAFGASQQEVIERATARFAEDAKDELFGVKDVQILNDNSPQAIRSYANALALIALDQTLPANAPTEAEILKRAYDTNNPDVLRELDPYIAGYTDMVNRTKSLAVPSSFAKEHLDLLNAMNAVKIDIEAMQSAFSDPLYTIVRMKRFEEDAGGMYITILNIQKRLIENNVPFQSTDPIWQVFAP